MATEMIQQQAPNRREQPHPPEKHFDPQGSLVPPSRPRTPTDIIKRRSEQRSDILSKTLSFSDFELLKTLGTGRINCYLIV